MWLSILAIWGCIPEFAKGCIDTTNSSSAYLGIAGGAAIGAVISWWMYNRQNKTARTHDDILQRIEKLEEKNRMILAHFKEFARRHDNVLNENILALDKKIESINEKRELGRTLQCEVEAIKLRGKTVRLVAIPIQKFIQFVRPLS